MNLTQFYPILLEEHIQKCVFISILQGMSLAIGWFPKNFLAILKLQYFKGFYVVRLEWIVRNSMRFLLTNNVKITKGKRIFRQEADVCHNNFPPTLAVLSWHSFLSKTRRYLKRTDMRVRVFYTWNNFFHSFGSIFT